MSDEPIIITNKCKHEPLDLHVCPYAADVENDTESLCDCCEDCTDACAADV